MKIKLSFLFFVLVKLCDDAYGSEGWTSDDGNSDFTQKGASASTAQPNVSGLWDEGFPGDSIEVYYERNDNGKVTGVLISYSIGCSDKPKQAMGKVTFQTLIVNAFGASTSGHIENNIKELCRVSKECALTEEQAKSINETIEKLKIELILAKNNELPQRKK